ncbi:MAG: DinB family protein, partial [Chloroflexota bacterium]|nr:DinB family protein [Chloroflexota bacterium]
MNQLAVVHQLAANAENTRHLLSEVADEQARWQPTNDDWSMLEVINHVIDEEREDFRTRLDYTLHKPGQPWPAIDPAGWVTARRYNERNLAQSLQNFLKEREQSVAWLERLVTPAWHNAETHPAGFTLTAGDLLAAWLAHDFLHLRQLVELRYLYHAQAVAPYSVQ